MGAGTICITWEKFRKDVLPTAERIEFLVPRGRCYYVAFVTAADPSAPPVLQWDSEQARNPISWYTREHGSLPSEWNLPAGALCEVSAIILGPHLWRDETWFTHQGRSVAFLLKDSHEVDYDKGGGLFVECLKSCYHPVRATLEAHFASTQIQGKDQAEACGIFMKQGTGANWNQVFRVTSNGLSLMYKLDRWD